jgi:NAD(P)H dehydrogenase (quinone)
MPEKKILVTGATGATGIQTTRFLLEKGFPVRALVHQFDQRSQELEDSGAEVVLGNLLDFNPVRAALQGVDRACFVFPIRPDLLVATAFFAQAASEVNLEAIVNMSQITAREDAKSHAAQNHWIAERIFDRSGVPVTHLRSTLFAEWFLYFPSVVKSGVVRLPFGAGKLAAIAGKDIARVTAAILTNPEPHIGKIYPLYGPVEMTFAEMTQVIGRTLGKELRYTQIDMDTFARDFRPKGYHADPFFYQHIGEIVIDHQNGVTAGTNDLVEMIGGVPPTTIQAFALEHRAAFE